MSFDISRERVFSHSKNRRIAEHVDLVQHLRLVGTHLRGVCRFLLCMLTSRNKSGSSESRPYLK